MSNDTTGAWGIGLATFAGDRMLDAWFPDPPPPLEGAPAHPGTREVQGALAGDLQSAARGDDMRNVRTAVIATVLADLIVPPADTADAYLRLHLLSHRLIRPHGANLDGIFGLLTNVAWTSAGPGLATGLPRRSAALRAARGHVTVFGVDKFPRTIDSVVPPGVRVADGDRVRLGAHLAEGTTVMHEGFVNYNAGTLGPSMVEGRISAGVVVGPDSDVGGGASIMGTLSGGGTEVVSIGRGCLLGANAGIGISLGGGCVVEAGCYVTAGSRGTLPGGLVVKARELSGRAGVLYRRNSMTGALEALPREGTWGALN